MRRPLKLPKVMRSKEPLGDGVPSDEWVKDGRLHILLSSDLTEVEADAERDRIIAKYRRRGLVLLPVAVLGRTVVRHAREHAHSPVVATAALAVAGGALAAVALPSILNHHHARPPLAGPRPTAVAPPSQPARGRQPRPGAAPQPPPSAAPARPGVVRPYTTGSAPSRPTPRRTTAAPPTAARPSAAPPPAQAAAPTIQPVSQMCPLNVEVQRLLRIRLCL